MKFINKLKKIGKFLLLIVKPRTWLNLLKWLRDTFSFVVLLSAYMAAKLVAKIANSRLMPKVVIVKFAAPSYRFYKKIIDANQYREDTINRVNLIELSINNMRYKLSRTLITIGGMSVGIASIVFLVSIGFGLQELVISRVARLDEMKQADVTSQPGSNAKINDKVLSSFDNMEEVNKALPLIALVGKVNYNNSVTDMAVYGVTTEYLESSAIKPVEGDMFQSNDLAFVQPRGDVAGASTEAPKTEFHQSGEEIGEIEFNLYPDTWLVVRKAPDIKAESLGLTKRAEGIQTGVEVYGTRYPSFERDNKIATDENGEELAKWIKGKFYIWKYEDDNYVQLLDTEGRAIQEEGYIAQSGMTTNRYTLQQPQVLGDSDVADTTPDASTISIEQLLKDVPEATQSKEDSWILLESGADTLDKTKKVDLPPSAVKQAVVNRAMLRVLGIDENKAVGQEFEVSFIATSTLLGNQEDKIESNPTKYKIVGIIPQEDTPFFYVPFIDLRALGITNYSQVKILAKNQDVLESARKKIESMGFISSSVVDTVNQINSLFGTVRIVLAMIGTVALGVASMGMFNTLTVSLLERTHEIGLMKAMGMKSNEVRELFLTESMLMGFFGGLMGIVAGFAAGKAISLILTIFAVTKGIGIVDIAYLPSSFVFIVLALSLVVGTVTGVYPARRATKISALNALRYE